jgi:hypothetical protein
MEVSCQLHVPAALPLGGKSPGTYRTGGWEGPRVGPVVVERINTRIFQTVQFHLRKYVKTVFPWKLHEKQVMTHSHTKSIINGLLKIKN